MVRCYPAWLVHALFCNLRCAQRSEMSRSVLLTLMISIRNHRCLSTSLHKEGWARLHHFPPVKSPRNSGSSKKVCPLKHRHLKHNRLCLSSSRSPRKHSLLCLPNQGQL